MVDAVKSKVVDRSEFRSIIDACCSLLSQESSYEVRFIRRQVNMVAHTLARAANSYASPFVAFDSPSFISDVLIHDCNDSTLVN